ncbi:cytochrome c biogenesis protein [[Eubacterium] cellulosolvens]
MRPLNNPHPLGNFLCHYSKKLFLFTFLFTSLLLLVSNSINIIPGEIAVDRAQTKRDNQAVDDSTRNSNYGNITLAFFYDPGCECTKEVLPEIKKLEQEYPEVKQVWYNITYPVNHTLLIDFQFEDAYNVPNRLSDDTPFLFIGDYYFHHYGVSFENVSAVIELYNGRDVPLWPVWELAWTMHVAFFYDPLAEATESILETLQSLNTTWNSGFRHFIVHDYSFQNETNVLWFREYFEVFNLSIKTQVKDPAEISAAVFIGDDFLLTSTINYSSLNETITKYSGQNTPLPDITIELSGGKICVLFFYSVTCGTCNSARAILENLKAKYPDLDVHEYNVGDKDNLILQHSYFEYYDVKTEKRGTLGIFIGDNAFVSDDVEYGDLKSDLEEQIQRYEDGCQCPDVEADEKVVIDLFNSFTVSAVLIAGLIDGLNPCAFATLIFFITYLAATGRTKKQILAIGVTFTLGVFVTYMVLGLGLYQVFHSAEQVQLISMLIYPIMGIIALLFGLYSVYDFTKARKGKKEDMKLQLPKPIKRLTARFIKHQVQLKYLALIAVITGIVISLFEFMCTGQVYLPTIVYVMGVSAYQSQAILLLFLYNFMFVLPLIIIFGAAYAGKGSEHLQEFLDRQRGHIKLITAIIFFILGIFLIWYSSSFVP